MFSFSYKETIRLPERKIAKAAVSVQPYLKQLRTVASGDEYDVPEASLQLLNDDALRASVIEVVQSVHVEHVQLIVVVGIGGSNLGTMAIYEALYGTYDLIAGERWPKMLFLDTVSSEKMLRVVEAIKAVSSLNNIVIVGISKSGRTTETIGNLETLLAYFDHEIKERVILITDEGSALWNAGEAWSRIAVPKMVGGRFSVFSAVGLVPLYIAGIDIEALHKGAAAALEDCLSDSLETNPALVSAVSTFLHNQAGVSMHNTFMFNPELESVGLWYRQLMGESLGKEKDVNDKVVRRGITPLASIGSTDLHSIAQLYFGGPIDKVTNIVYSEDTNAIKVPKTLAFGELVEGIAGKSYQDIMNAIIGGVESAYKKNEAPYIKIVLPPLSEYSIAYYLQFRMVEIMLLAKLLNVNAFDQPNVEDYKNVTRKLLVK